jgi:hypothetical protein
LPDGLATTGTVLLDQLVTLDYQARLFQFVETVPADFLLQLLDVARRIFTIEGYFFRVLRRIAGDFRVHGRTLLQ